MTLMEEVLQKQANDKIMKDNNKQDQFMELYMEKNAHMSINDETGIFSKSALNQKRGINSKEALFNRKCVFRTVK